MRSFLEKKNTERNEVPNKASIFFLLGFHYAGDGKLGGIVKPNDGFCHLEKGRYTHSKVKRIRQLRLRRKEKFFFIYISLSSCLLQTQDYPSVSQINYKVKEHSINMIFAVTEEQFDVYSHLKENIEGSSAGTLSADSSNIVELVQEQYAAITSSIEMKDNATGFVRVTYFSNCDPDDPGAPVKQTSVCNNIKVNSKVMFTGEGVVVLPKFNYQLNLFGINFILHLL